MGGLDQQPGSADQIWAFLHQTGQYEFIEELRELTDSLGTGLIYWEVSWSHKGPQGKTSPYENQAL